jgi:hypothetical protein
LKKVVYAQEAYRKNVCFNQRAYRKKRKKESMTPLQNKSKRRVSNQGVFRETNKNIPHTCTSRSSCITSFFLDPIFGSTTSCGTSKAHTYPTQNPTYKP